MEKSACFCLDCFDMEKHKGHIFIFGDNASGYCDCGNPHFIPPDSFCDKHHSNEKPVIDPE